MDNNVLGKRMRYIREKKDLKQNKVAKDLSVSKYQLSRYESGSNKPDPEMLAKISKYYNVSSDYLLGLTNDLSPLNKDEIEYLKAINDPELKRWIIEDLSLSDDDDLKKLRAMWDIIKSDKND